MWALAAGLRRLGIGVDGTSAASQSLWGMTGYPVPTLPLYMYLKMYLYIYIYIYHVHVYTFHTIHIHTCVYICIQQVCMRRRLSSQQPTGRQALPSVRPGLISEHAGRCIDNATLNGSQNGPCKPPPCQKSLTPLQNNLVANLCLTVLSTRLQLATRLHISSHLKTPPALGPASTAYFGASS